MTEKVKPIIHSHVYLFPWRTSHRNMSLCLFSVWVWVHSEYTPLITYSGIAAAGGTTANRQHHFPWYPHPAKGKNIVWKTSVWYWLSCHFSLSRFSLSFSTREIHFSCIFLNSPSFPPAIFPHPPKTLWKVSTLYLLSGLSVCLSVCRSD